MNLRDLKYLVALAETRHFGQAAEQCSVSQPTLSAALRKLEDELGVALFERSKRHVEPTAVGLSVVAQARQVLSQADEIELLAQAARDPLSGALRLGLIPTLAPYFLPGFLDRLSATLPEIQLGVREDQTERLLAALKQGELDAAILAAPLQEPGLESLFLFEEAFYLALPDGHVLAAEEEITEQDLLTADLLLLAEGHCLRGQALALCQWPQKQGPDLTASSLETLIQLTIAGRGVTLLPELAARQAQGRPGLILRELALPLARRQMVLVYRSTSTRLPAFQALAEVARTATVLP
ncbi:LysR substrate-binding domain-containing protein [Rhodovibrionaceae bacterium A322]